MEEIWKYINGYEGIYKVSNMGEIEITRPKCRKKTIGCLSPNGYLYFNLLKDGNRIRKLVHRIVAETFIPNPYNKPCVDHINTIKTDNRVQNLRWVTEKENVNNPISLERLRNSNSLGNKWKNVRKVKVIHVYLIFEKRNYYFSSVMGIFRHLSEDQIGIKQSTLSHNTDNTIVTGRAIIRKSELLR